MNNYACQLSRQLTVYGSLYMYMRYDAYAYLETTTLYQKYASVNRGTIMPNFIPIRYENTEPWVLKSVPHQEQEQEQEE